MKSVITEEFVCLTRVGSFDSAHYLPNYEGKCKNMHGHHWKVELEVRGFVNPKTGMLIDFSVLKKVLGKLTDKLDHKILNDYIENPTAENIAVWFRSSIKRSLRHLFKDKGLSVSISIWETENSKVRV